MLTRIICASALVSLAGAGAHAQQAVNATGVFEWHADDAQPARGESKSFRWVSNDDDQSSRSMTIERNEDTVLIFAPSAKGGTRASFSDGVKVVELRLDGDRILDLDVTVNGKPISGSNGKVESGHIIIFSPDGKTIAEFMAPPGDDAKREITWHAQPAQPNQPRGLARVRAAGGDADGRALVGALVNGTPRRIIGITASTPGEALAAQLGLQPDQVIVVDSVNDGFPADKAGIKRFDIITKVDGSGPANLGRLTEIIQSKGDADSIRLTIIRGGQERVVELRPILEEQNIEMEWEIDENSNFPAGVEGLLERFGQGERVRIEEAMMQAREALAMQQVHLRELQSHLEQKMNEVGRQLKQKLNDENVSEDVRRAYQQAVEEIREVNVQEQLERALAEVNRAMSEVEVQRETRSLPEIKFFERGQANGRGVVIAPAAPAAPSAPNALRVRGSNTQADNARLQNLEERMARIEALLERLVDERGR
jgi:uncharacterized protein (UPF0147 family)